MNFSLCFLFLVIFLPSAFWVVHNVRFCIFSDDVFSRETIRCFLAPALSLRSRIPYLSANRLKPKISRDQRIQTCHPAVPKVYTHFISFGQIKMANASGNFRNTLVGLRTWNNAIHDFRRIFSNRKKQVFSGI